MYVKTALKFASLKLKKNKIFSYKLDSEILMSEVFKKRREEIILNPDCKLRDSQMILFKKLLTERSKGKPISYITGKKDFWKNEFIINKNSLVPRPDSELIVQEVLKYLKNKTSLKLLEIGVGSGCILLSVLNERKDSYGTGIDISKECIDLTEINSKKLGIINRIKFYKSDIDNFNLGKYDLIISNPPYIKKQDIKYLEKDVVNFEPKKALDGGLDGLSVIKKVINRSSKLIKLRGKLFLEIAFDQKREVLSLLENKGFYINRVLKDLGNNDRCVICTKI